LHSHYVVLVYTDAICHSQRESLIVTHQKYPRFYLVQVTDAQLLESIGE